MKKYFIPINLRSIKKNPNAGATVTYLPGRKVAEFTALSRPAILKANEEYIITSVGNGYITGVIKGQEAINKIIKDMPHDFSLNIKTEVVELNHMPEPYYFFEYRKIKVKCSSCGAQFDHSELETEESLSGDLLFNICPRCQDINCCDIEYEKIGNALKRIK